MFIFLDIDGVLLPSTLPSVALDPACVGRFEEVVREFSAARIVVSSGWRLLVPLESIRKRFSPDVAERIVGETPHLEGTRKMNRYQEVLTYLRAQPEPAPWVAVDDDPRHYPEEAVDLTLVLTDPESGFDSGAAARLRRLLLDDEPDPVRRAWRRRIESGVGLGG
jgi:hypothetical protein